MAQRVKGVEGESRPLVDLFCGAGGLSLGLVESGFMPVFAFDHDPHACETYRQNIGRHVLEANAVEITPDLICSASGFRPGEFSLVCGGPPCQGFSVQRRGSRNDHRNELVVWFVKVAVALRPAAILMENV